MRVILSVCLWLCGAASVVFAAPKVVTDIAPVHSIATFVMRGVGDADVLLTPESSPHHFTLKPSHMRKLSRADIFFYVGPELIPSLAKLETQLPASAKAIDLLEAPQLTLRRIEEDEEHSDHGHSHDHDTHEGLDPHAWLNPDNAKIWAMTIAGELAQLDQEHASVYRENAQDFAQSVDQWGKSAKEDLGGSSAAYIVLHDAYGYFAHHFNLDIRAAVFDGTGLGLSAGHLRDVEDEIYKGHVSCLFTEPQLSDAPLKAFEHLNLDVVELDPLGTRLPMGAALYLDLMDRMKNAFVQCTAG